MLMAEELRVLVVDDNPDILWLLKQLLEAERCQVTLCADGSSALARISQEPFHLILCDVVMPGVSGLEVLERSNPVAEGIPLVLISGYTDAESAIFALRHGAFDYFAKPFRLDDIRDLLHRVRELFHLGEGGAGQRTTKRAGLGHDRPREVLIKKSRALDLAAGTGKILGEIHDLGRLMEVILTLAMQSVRAERGALLVSSRCGERLKVAAVRGFGDAVVAGDEVASEPELWGSAPSPSQAAWLTVPLAVKGEPVGRIVLADGEGAERASIVDRRVVNILAQQASLALENASLYANLEATVFEGMRALVTALEAKDPYTEGHSMRVARLAVQICHEAGLPENVEDVVRYAGVLHDIGKVGIPDAILQKPEELTPAEYERMKTHPVVGYNILMPFSFLQEEALSVRHHHEWWSGKGYPDGLREAAIPLPARILAVADAYDAMTTIRPHRGPLGHEAALEELCRHAGTQFDPEVADLFLSLPSRELSPPTPPHPKHSER